jgi:hypothetical protein
MDLSRKADPDVFSYDYPHTVETGSDALSSTTFIPESHAKVEITSPKPELTIREHTSWLDPALVMRPLDCKHLRTSSLPEAALPVLRAIDEQCSLVVVPGSILPNKGQKTKASSDAETADVKSRAAIGDRPQCVDLPLAATAIKKHRRSISSGVAHVTQLAQQVTAEEYETQFKPHIQSLKRRKHRGSVTKSEEDTTSFQPKSEAEGSAPCTHSESLRSSSKQDRPNACPDTSTTILEPQAPSDGYFLFGPVSKSQPKTGSCMSSNAGNISLLPPQEWTPDTYQPIISPASIPLPVSTLYRSSKKDFSALLTIPIITVTTPDDKAEEPSEKIVKLHRRADGLEILDSSRLHPNAAWSQVAHRMHKTNLKLVNENDILRLQNEALKNMLAKFSSALADMGMDKQMEFQKRLTNMPAVPPKGGAGGPRGTW